MASKVFAGLVVAFWLTMMVALVRFEFYPKAEPLGNVSTERLLRKVFATREPARMNVYYQKEQIGSCRVEIAPLSARDARPSDTFEGVPQAFLVQTDLDMKLVFFGTPSRFHLVSYTRLTPHYEVYDFKVGTSIGGSRVEVYGDEQSKKINVTVDTGETFDTQQFDFDTVRGNGLGGLLALPGLANLGFPGPAAFFGGSGTGLSAPPTIGVVEVRFSYGDISQRAYRLDIRSADTMWARIWIADSGEILYAETSMGVTMISDLLDGTENTARARMAAPRLGMRGHRPHDSY